MARERRFAALARIGAASALILLCGSGSPGGSRLRTPDSPRGSVPRTARFADLLAGTFEAGAAPGTVLGRGRSLTILVDGAGATLAARGARLRMRFPRGLAVPEARASVPLERRSHYVRGRAPSRWRRDVPHFAEARGGEAAPGVRTLYRFRGPDPECTFEVQAGADPAGIVVALEGAASLAVDGVGRLLAGTPGGVFAQSAPRAFEGGGDRPREVTVRYVLLGDDRYGFEVGPRDASRALRIDPVLTFSTPLGGSEGDSAAALAFAPDGTLWIAGSSESTDVPTLAGTSGTSGYTDAVVLRLDPVAGQVLSATWIGGTYHEFVGGLAFDADGNAFLAGTTPSNDFPAAGGPLTVPPGWSTEVFVAKLPPDGSGFVWSTFLGGWRTEYFGGIAVTSGGDPIVCGTTESEDFPLKVPAQAEFRGWEDAFVTRIRGDGSEFVFSTYLGGGSWDYGSAVAVAADGAIVLGGVTLSDDLAPTSLLSGEWPHGGRGFLAEVDPWTGATQRAVFLGANSPADIAAEPSGTVLVLGTSGDPTFPAPAAPHGPPGPEDDDAFVLRIDRGLSEVLAGMLYGGSGDESPNRIARTADGTIWIAGATESTDLPGTVPVAVLPDPEPWIRDAFLAAVDLDRGATLEAVCLGGSSGEEARDLALAPDGAPWICGGTDSPDFPLVASLKEPPSSRSDMFVCRFVPGVAAPRPRSPDGLEAEALGGSAVRIRWQDLSDDEAGFAVFRIPREEFEGWSWRWPYTRIATVPAGTTEFVDRTALPDRHYLYAVRAFNDEWGSSVSPPADAWTPATLEFSVEAGRRWASGFLWEGSTTVLRGTLLPVATSGAGTLDFAADGLLLEFSSPDPYYGGGSFRIPPGDPGWRATPRGLRWRDRYRWGSRLGFDSLRGTFRFRLVRGNGRWDPWGGGPFRIRLTAGKEAGSTGYLKVEDGRLVPAYP